MNATTHHRITAIILSYLGIIGGASGVWADSNPVEMLRPIIKIHNPDKVFAPPGFDSNDNAELVLTGTFMNSCYQVATPELKIDEEKKTIIVEDRAYVPTENNSWCLMVLVPYQKTIKLGQLNAGEYEVLVHQMDGRTQPMAKLPVSKAHRPGQDNYHYARVSEAHLEIGETALKPVLKLSLQLPDRCSRLQEVKVLYRTQNVVEVLPVLRLENGPNCGQTRQVQVETIKLELPWAGESLIHIRSAGGQSINLIHDSSEGAASPLVALK